jgi:hypothetical protein
MSYTRAYKEMLVPEQRISRGEIKPRNIYRISTYKGGDTETKTGEDTRYVFVLGRVGNKLHCIKLNNIKPLDFTNLLFKLREKRVPIGKDNKLNLLLKHFSTEGNELFEQHVKHDSKIYGPGLNNYRIYLVGNIVNAWEIRFEDFFLRKLFKEESTPDTRSEIIKNEIAESDNETNTIDSPK